MINDLLSTTTAYINALRHQPATSSTFEDLGPSARRTRIFVVDAIYPERERLAQPTTFGDRSLRPCRVHGVLRPDPGAGP